MAAETLTGLRAKSNIQPASHGYGSAMYGVWGHYTIAADTEDGDVFEMCWTPDGFLCLGGWFSAGDLDTGTEAIDIDLGWAANGTSSQESFVTPWGQTFTDSGYSASATGLVNSGVLTGDPITDLMASGLNFRPIVLPTPLWFYKSTKIQLEANAAAGTFASASATCCLIGQIIQK